MRESISGTTLFMLVIFFIIIFAGYLCFSINQSRAFAVKSGIVRIIERYGAVNNIQKARDLEKVRKGYCTPSDSHEKSGSFSCDIKNELANVGYRTKGYCNKKGDKITDWTAFDAYGKVVSDGNGVFCVKMVSTEKTGNKNSPKAKFHYFMIKTFYHFDIFGNGGFLNLTVEGNTKVMQ